MEIKPGKYRHFKGKEYELVAVAIHSETMEPMVATGRYMARADFGSGPCPCGTKLWNGTATVAPDFSQLTAKFSIFHSRPVHNPLLRWMEHGKSFIIS